jgi:AcrR family transcriptional regulator
MARAEREQLILEVAGQVFARGGYHAASMEEIAQLAGVSKPMLYAYFSSKEGLYLAYVQLTGQDLVDRLQAAAQRDDPIRTRLVKRINEFLAFVEEHRDGWIVLFREQSASTPLAEEVADLRGQIAFAVRRMIESSLPSGVTLTPHAADGIANATVGAGEGLANWWLRNPEAPREEVAGWYVGLVEAAVMAAARPDPPESSTPT